MSDEVFLSGALAVTVEFQSIFNDDPLLPPELLAAALARAGRPRPAAAQPAHGDAAANERQPARAVPHLRRPDRVDPLTPPPWRPRGRGVGERR